MKRNVLFACLLHCVCLYTIDGICVAESLIIIIMAHTIVTFTLKLQVRTKTSNASNNQHFIAKAARRTKQSKRQTKIAAEIKINTFVASEDLREKFTCATSTGWIYSLCVRFVVFLFIEKKQFHDEARL